MPSRYRCPWPARSWAPPSPSDASRSWVRTHLGQLDLLVGGLSRGRGNHRPGRCGALSGNALVTAVAITAAYWPSAGRWRAVLGRPLLPLASNVPRHGWSAGWRASCRGPSTIPSGDQELAQRPRITALSCGVDQGRRVRTGQLAGDAGVLAISILAIGAPVPWRPTPRLRPGHGGGQPGITPVESVGRGHPLRGL